MFVHACHCTACQRRTGSAFAAFYDLKSTWPDASRKRLRALMSD